MAKRTPATAKDGNVPPAPRPSMDDGGGDLNPPSGDVDKGAIKNLIDFLPSGSFAFFQSIIAVISLPADSTTCDFTQKVYVIMTLFIVSIFVFVTTMTPSRGHPLYNDRRLLVARSFLAVFAFLGLSIPMQNMYLWRSQRNHF